jgi:hypothetical protein
MRDTPSSVENTTTYVPEISVKKREKETEEPVVSQQAKKKGKKLQFSPEEVTTPSKPVTRSTTKRMSSMHTSQAPEEDPKSFTETDFPNDKDNLIIELQEQLKKSHFVIAQLQHENREMKKKYLEQASKKDISVIGETSVPVTPTSSKTKGKGKAVEQSPEVKEIPKPIVPLTRSSAKKLKTQEEPPTKSQPIEKKSTTCDEGQHTFKILRKQLREAQDMIIQQREENRREKMKCIELLDDCEPAIDNTIFMVKRNLPLHKQLKNIYQQNMTLRKEK